MADVSFNVEKNFGVISSDGKWDVMLTMTSWNGRTAKYDIRSWSPDFTRCGKGITLTKSEAKELRKLLCSLELD